jgi:hypothetical protein
LPPRLSKPPRRRIDIEELRRLTDGMPHQEISSADFIRWMRDTDRYRWTVSIRR